jgi:hypothetical protein
MVTLVNRAKMSTSTTGTGTITLGSAETGYQTFADAGVADGDVVRYVIEDGNDWEIGSGTYTATGTTLSRTVSESSNADAALNLTGSAVVFITAAAGDVFQGELFAENPSSPTAPSSTGTNAVAIGSESVSAGLRSVSLGDSYASGTDSFAAAIANNTSSYGATGTNSIAMGYQNKATGAYSFAAGEDSSTASGYGSVAIGRNSTASGDRGVAIGSSCTAGSTVSSRTNVAMGNTCNASGGSAFAFGERSDTRGLYGKYAFSSGYGAGTGTTQTGVMVLDADTTDATATALCTQQTTTTAGSTNQIILPNNSAYSFSGTIIARQQASGGSDYASWEIKGALLRDANAASTVLGNGIVNKLYATAGASAWAVALTADTTNGGLKVEVTGAAATNIRWVATVNTSEVTYA